MTTETILYKYGNGTTEEKIRIRSDDGKVLTNDNGKTVWYSIDVDTVDGWEEITDPNPMDADTEATESDYITALQDLGVTVE